MNEKFGIAKIVGRCGLFSASICYAAVTVDRTNSANCLLRVSVAAILIVIRDQQLIIC